MSRNNSFSSIPGGATAVASSAASLSTSPAATAAQQAQLPPSRRASLTTSAQDARRRSRSASLASTVSEGEGCPVARTMSLNAIMNARVDSYFYDGSAGADPGSGRGAAEDGDAMPEGDEGGELMRSDGVDGEDEDDDAKMPGKMRQLSKRLTSLRLGRRKG